MEELNRLLHIPRHLLTPNQRYFVALLQEEVEAKNEEAASSSQRRVLDSVVGL